MNTKAILATLAVLGSSTAAMADTHFADHRITTAKPTVTIGRQVAATVSVQRPVMQPIITRPIVTTVSVQRPVVRPIVTRPIVTTVSVPRPVASRDRDRGHGPVVRDRDRDRGHGPVVRHPIIEQPIYQPVYQQPVYQPVYQQPVYQPVYQPAPQPVIDNCNANGTYVGPIGSLPDSYDNDYKSLTEPTEIIGGRETINLGAQVGPIDTLMLEANNSATTVASVQVNFLDGSSQRFNTRETLDVGNPSLTLDLGHRDVASLVVYGQSSPGGSYQLLAR